MITDFSHLQRPSEPNNALIGPADFAPAPDATAPVFDAPAAAVAREWLAVVESAPRTRILALSPDGLQMEAEQRSAVFGFVDRISARVLPITSERSTLVAYSRSQIGWWDLGVNRRRLADWIERLQARLRVAADGR